MVFSPPEEFLSFLDRHSLPLSLYTDPPAIPRYLFPVPSRNITYESMLLEFPLLARSTFLSSFYQLPGADTPIACSSLFKSHAILAMDIVCAFAVSLLRLCSSDHYLDLCCAPGQKLIYAALLIGELGGGSVTGVDISKPRLSVTRSLVKKHKLPRVRLFHQDALSFASPVHLVGDLPPRDLPSGGGGPTRPFYSSSVYRKRPGHLERGAPSYTKIIVDAECTHDGSIKHILKAFSSSQPSSGSHFSLDSEKRLESLQLRLLEHAFSLLAPLGLLVYCTCSLAASQNISIIDRFLHRHGSRATLCPLDHPLAAKVYPCAAAREGQALPPASPAAAAGNALGFWPPTSGTTGFFVALLQKTLPD